MHIISEVFTGTPRQACEALQRHLCDRDVLPGHLSGIIAVSGGLSASGIATVTLILNYGTQDKALVHPHLGCKVHYLLTQSPGTMHGELRAKMEAVNGLHRDPNDPWFVRAYSVCGIHGRDGVLAQFFFVAITAAPMDQEVPRRPAIPETV